jgi:hypothetical protein
MNDLMIKRAIWDKQIVIRKDDTISRQLAIEAIKRAIWDKQIAKDAIDAVCNIPCDACFRIDALPSIQPEQKKGKWIYSTNSESVCEEWTCNLCGAFSFGKTNFCHNCGADMRGEEDDD